MKKHLTAALAALLMAGTAGVASAQSHYDNGRYDHGRYDNSRYDNGRYDNNRYDGRHDNGRHNGWNHDRHNGWRSEWRRGARMDYGYWSRGERVDWRRHHLRRPAYGYEWREVNGNYVLAAVATGLIADLIMNNNY